MAEQRNMGAQDALSPQSTFMWLKGKPTQIITDKRSRILLWTLTLFSWTSTQPRRRNSSTPTSNPTPNPGRRGACSLVCMLVTVCQNLGPASLWAANQANQQPCWPSLRGLCATVFGNSRKGSCLSGGALWLCLGSRGWKQWKPTAASQSHRVQSANCSCPRIQSHFANGERSF